MIENRPALKVIQQHDSPETLHYVDAPYVQGTRGCGGRKHGYHYDMTDGQHRALARVLRSVEGMVVLSGYPCELYEELYGDWWQDSRTTFADGARPREERLWLNPAAANGLQGLLQFGRGLAPEEM